MDENFVLKILFADESTLRKKDMTNRHSWAEENHQAVLEKHSQCKFKVNIWMGILGTHIIGPYKIANDRNGTT